MTGMSHVPLPVDQAVSAWSVVPEQTQRAASYEEINKQLDVKELDAKQPGQTNILCLSGENELHTVEVVKRSGGEYYAVVDGVWTPCKVGKTTTASLPEYKKLYVKQLDGDDPGPTFGPAPVAVSLCVESGETFPEKCILVVKQQFVVKKSGERAASVSNRDTQLTETPVLSTVAVEIRSASDSISKPTLLPYPIASTAAPSLELSTYNAMYLAEARVKAFQSMEGLEMAQGDPANALTTPPTDAVKYYQDRAIDLDNLREELSVAAVTAPEDLTRLANGAEADLWRAANKEPTIYRITLHQLAREIEHISESRADFSHDRAEHIGKTPDKLKSAGRRNAAALLRYLLTAETPAEESEEESEEESGEESGEEEGGEESKKDMGHWSLEERLKHASDFLAFRSDLRSHARADLSGLNAETLRRVHVKLVYDIQVFERFSDASPSLTIRVDAIDAVSAGYSASGYVNRAERTDKKKEELLTRIRGGVQVNTSDATSQLYWDALYAANPTGEAVGRSNEVTQKATEIMAEIIKKCKNKEQTIQKELDAKKSRKRDIDWMQSGPLAWFTFYTIGQNPKEVTALRNERNKLTRAIWGLERQLEALQKLKRELNRELGINGRVDTLQGVYNTARSFFKQVDRIEKGDTRALVGSVQEGLNGIKEALKPIDPGDALGYVKEGVCIFDAAKANGLLKEIMKRIRKTVKSASDAKTLDDLATQLQKDGSLLLRQTSPAIVLTGATRAFSLGDQPPPQYSSPERELVTEACKEASRALKRCSKLFDARRKAVGAASLRLRFERLYTSKRLDKDAESALVAASPPTLFAYPFSTCLFSSTVAPVDWFDADYRASKAGGASLDRAIRIAAGPTPDPAWHARLERQCTRQAASVMAELLAVCLLSRAHAGVDPQSRVALTSSLTEDARHAALTVSKFISEAYVGDAPRLAGVNYDHPCFSCVPGFEYVKSALYALGLFTSAQGPPLVVGAQSRLRAEQMRLVARALRAMSAAPLSAANLPFPCAQSALLMLPRAVSAATGEASALQAHSRASELSLSRIVAAATDLESALESALGVGEMATSRMSLLLYAALSHPAVVARALAASKTSRGILSDLESLLLTQAQRGDAATATDAAPATAFVFEQGSWKKPARAVWSIALDERLAGFRLDIPAEVMKEVPPPFSREKSDYEGFVERMLTLSLDSDSAVYFVPAGVFGKGSPSTAPDTTLFQKPIWMEDLRHSAGRTWHWTKPSSTGVWLQQFGSDSPPSKRAQLGHPCAVEVDRNSIRVFLCRVPMHTEKRAQGLTVEVVRRLVHNVERLTQALFVLASSHFRPDNRVLVAQPGSDDAAQPGSDDAAQLAAAACTANALFRSLTGSDARIIVEDPNKRSHSAIVCQALARMASSLLERDLKAMPLGELCGVLCCYVLGLKQTEGGESGDDSSDSSDGPPPL